MFDNAKRIIHDKIQDDRVVKIAFCASMDFDKCKDCLRNLDNNLGISGTDYRRFIQPTVFEYDDDTEYCDSEIATESDIPGFSNSEGYY